MRSKALLPCRQLVITLINETVWVILCSFENSKIAHTTRLCPAGRFVPPGRGKGVIRAIRPLLPPVRDQPVTAANAQVLPLLARASSRAGRLSATALAAFLLTNHAAEARFSPRLLVRWNTP